MSKDGGTELKPCPFCNGEAEIKECEVAPMAYARCVAGCCEQLSRERNLDIIKSWNTRPVQSEGVVVAGIRNILDKLVTDEGLSFQVIGNSILPNHHEDIIMYLSEKIAHLTQPTKPKDTP